MELSKECKSICRCALMYMEFIDSVISRWRFFSMFFFVRRSYRLDMTSTIISNNPGSKVQVLSSPRRCFAEHVRLNQAPSAAAEKPGQSG
jgi:hypothetical protein